MKRQGLQGIKRGKIVHTTMGDAAVPCPLDRVNRQFQADRPNQLWVSDFTYVSTWQGWLYVAFVIDVFAAHRGLAREQFHAHGLRARCPGAGTLRSPARAIRWSGASQP